MPPAAATPPLAGLQDWYLRACDGEWEGAPGLQLDACREGWAIHAPLDPGPAEGAGPELTIERTADDWLHAWVDGSAFHADCGPLSLTETIRTYLSWAARG